LVADHAGIYTLLVKEAIMTPKDQTAQDWVASVSAGSRHERMLDGYSARKQHTLMGKTG
jgi:hypothetical protein